MCDNIVTRAEAESRLATIRKRHFHLFRYARSCDIQIPPGWLSLVEAMCDDVDAMLKPATRALFSFTAVQEKYASLRVDYEGPISDSVQSIIEMAEHASSLTCMYCGDPGVLRGDTGSDFDWLYVSCDRHVGGHSLIGTDGETISARQPPDRPMPMFLDWEASSLSVASYPTEVAWCDATGMLESHLIDPSSIASWRDWDPAAQAITGISRQLLRAEGVQPHWLALRMNVVLRGAVLYCDGLPYDTYWRNTLFSACGVIPTFEIRDSDKLFYTRLAAQPRSLTDALLGRPPAAELLEQIKIRAREMTIAQGYPAHRAANDVRYLMTAYRMITEFTW